jgi:hypothetical protein
MHRPRSIYNTDVLFCRIFHYIDVLHDHNQHREQLILMQLQVSGAGVSGAVHQARADDPHQEGAQKNRPKPDQVLHPILTDHHVMRLQVLQPAPPTRYRSSHQPISHLPDHQEHLLLVLNPREAHILCRGAYCLLNTCGVGHTRCVLADDVRVSV